MFFNGWMATQTVVYAHNGILFSSKKEKLLIQSWWISRGIILSDNSQIKYFLIPLMILKMQGALQRFLGVGSGGRGWLLKGFLCVCVMLRFYIPLMIVETNVTHKTIHQNSEYCWIFFKIWVISEQIFTSSITCNKINK